MAKKDLPYGRTLKKKCPKKTIVLQTVQHVSCFKEKLHHKQIHKFSFLNFLKLELQAFGVWKAIFYKCIINKTFGHNLYKC